MSHIFLYGPSGAGKSAVGKTLAEKLNLSFSDLDAYIERKAGVSIPEIMSRQGEPYFRELEHESLKALLSGAGAVIALGGGALLREDNLSLAESAGEIVCLYADLPTLLARLSQDDNARPLLAGNLESRLAGMLTNRQAHYDSFSLRVDAAGAPQEVAWEIQRLLGRFHVYGMGQGYDVQAQPGGVDHLGEMLQARDLRGRILVISDRNVAHHYEERAMASLHTAGYQAVSVVITPGETHKTIDTVSRLWRGCLEGDLDRKSVIVALGGGVVGDLAGFTAATFMRGINWVAVPTSLLAMVDASMGGKTGFDLPEGKNLVGAFHPPRLVLADPDVLSTLPERELRAGLAEVVKHGVIADPALFALCALGWKEVITRLPEVVRRAMAVKVRIIMEDPFESGVRAALNYGHTVGHAVELVSGFALLHGEAVAIGMVSEARLAERLSIASQGVADRIVETLAALGLPSEIPASLSREDLVRAMRVDKKKAAGVVRFALPARIGEVKVGVAVENLEEAL